MLVPDLSGDGLADVVIAAPMALVGNAGRGIMVARSPKSGDELWKREQADGENLGWDLAQAGDQDGDGRLDFFVGAPSTRERARVLLLSGRDGSVLRTYADRRGLVLRMVRRPLDDLDGDSRADLAVGAPTAANADGRWSAPPDPPRRAAKELRYWTGRIRASASAACSPQSGPSTATASATPPWRAHDGKFEAREHPGGGCHSTSSGKGSGWSGRQPGAQFARMIVSAGVSTATASTVATGTVASSRRRRQGRRVEFRSAKTGVC